MPEVRLTAGIILIRKTESGCRYLVLRAYNYWDFSKGMLDAGESAIQAARREVAEETGITRLEFHWNQQYYQTEPYDHNKVARYYLAQTDEEKVVFGINPELGRPEHHEYRWASFQQARELLNDRVRAALEWAHHISGCDRI